LSGAPVILQLLSVILPYLPWLYGPRPAWLSRHGSCPADGFHPSSHPGYCPSYARDLLSPFLIGLGALFLTAALLPASMLKSAVATGITVADVLEDGAEIVTVENPGLGMEGDNLSEPAGLSFGHAADRAMLLSDIHSEVSPDDVPDTAGIGDESPSIPARLAALSSSRTVWMFAAGPWVWCLFSWHVPRVPRRRIRRVRYER